MDYFLNSSGTIKFVRKVINALPEKRVEPRNDTALFGMTDRSLTEYK